MLRLAKGCPQYFSVAGLFLIFWTTRFAAQLALDQNAVLYPDVDSPFSDTVDAVNRLLPYHVYQQPKEDLEPLMSSHKGKGKATEDLRQEISGMYVQQIPPRASAHVLLETKFAIECFKRRKALQDRLHQVKVRSAKVMIESLC